MSVNDAYGFPLGRNPYGRPVNLDTWNRANNNMLITGATGSGKTIAMQHILLQQFYRGVVPIVIDLNREYKDLCKDLGGYWVDGDTDYVTCPPEVLSAKFIVFDMYDLRKASEELRYSHYSKVLSWAWNRISASTDERVMLIIDDFYKFGLGNSRYSVMDTQQVEGYRDALFKQFAKVYHGVKYYNSGTYIITNHIDTDISALARNTSYLLLMAVAHRQVKSEIILDIHCIGEHERRFLAQGVKWTALLIAGRDTEIVSIELPDDSVSLIKPRKWRFF